MGTSLLPLKRYVNSEQLRAESEALGGLVLEFASSSAAVHEAMEAADYLGIRIHKALERTPVELARINHIVSAFRDAMDRRERADKQLEAEGYRLSWSPPKKSEGQEPSPAGAEAPKGPRPEQS
jgi:hypothetical protein